MPNSDHTIGDAPIDPEYHQLMNDVARFLDRMFNGPPGSVRKNGFVLLLFPFNSEGRCNYISNSERTDIVKLFKEQIKHFEESKSKKAHNHDPNQS